MQTRVANHGSALISALFIMTLVAIAATAMSTRLQLDIYRTRLTISSDQLYLASQAVSFWAMDTLKEKKRFTVKNGQGKLASFPSKLQHLYPGIQIKGEIYDLQARFNVNNLHDKKFHPLFFKLLEHTLTDNNNEQHRALLKAIYHWISPYQVDRPDNHLNTYLRQHSPYIPSYQLMRSVSELRLINGVSDKIYQELLPHITVLPEVTPININTASKWILMSLGNGLSETQLQELLKIRGKKGITDLNDIYPLLQKLDIPRDQITIESTYYLSVATTSSEDLNLTSYVIIKRGKDQQGHMTLGIVSESLNTM